MNTILLLHGALGAQTQLAALKAMLRKNLFNVHTLDFSGHHGVSFSPTGFGIEVFARDVLNYLDQNNIKEVDIFGYSMGGYVAVWLAYLFPDRVKRVITLGTKFDWSPESAEREVRKLNPEKIQQKVPAFARLLEHRHAPTDWKELILRTAQMMKQLGDQPLLTETIFASVKAPVTILLGDQDDMADRCYSQHVAGLVPNGRFELLPETPHPIEKVKLELIREYF
jgi:pimeloyl-ACP methyl ester carboxylesterase